MKTMLNLILFFVIYVVLINFIRNSRIHITACIFSFCGCFLYLLHIFQLICSQVSVHFDCSLPFLTFTISLNYHLNANQNNAKNVPDLTNVRERNGIGGQGLI